MQFKENKYKVRKIKAKQAFTKRILEEKIQADITLNESRKVLKKPVLLYDSDWSLSEKEDVEGSVTQEKGALLPERALYEYEVNLNIPQKFISDLKIEVLVRAEPNANIQGVFPYIGSSKRELSFQVYNYHGITQMTATSCPFPNEHLSQFPQPIELYSLDPQPGAWTFKYAVLNMPVPIGQDPSFVLPGSQIIGFENRLIYEVCTVSDPTFESYWANAGEKAFYELVNIYGLQVAKDLLNASYNNIIYTDESDNFKGTVANVGELPLTGNTQGDYYISLDVSVYYVWSKEEPDGIIEDWEWAGASVPKAYETVFTPQVATANQIKHIERLSERNISLKVSGDVLLISPANTEAIFSDPLFPTYQATNGGEVEARLKVYIDNPHYFTETKGYNHV